MYHYGQTSLKRLETCHPDLQRLANELIKYMDVTVVFGHRGEQEQMQAYKTGKSTKTWPNSKHNQWPSVAIDLAPYDSRIKGIPWKDHRKFYMMIGRVLVLAQQLDIPIRGGFDWDSDGDLDDQTLIDLPHFELIL